MTWTILKKSGGVAQTQFLGLLVVSSLIIMTYLLLGPVVLTSFAVAYSNAKKGSAVLLIGVDGFGGMYMENFTESLPNIKALIETGVATFRGRNFQPSVSAPNWGTILTGQSPQQSGIFGNEWAPQWPTNETATDPLLPPLESIKTDFGIIPTTVFALAKRSKPELKTAASVSWSWLKNLLSGGSNVGVDHFFDGNENDDKVAAEMCAMISTRAPDLMYVHFDGVDDAGHAHGWGSAQYYAAAANVDKLIGQLLECLSDAGVRTATQVLVTADHGGWQQSHDWCNEASMYVPFVMNGAGLNKALNLTTAFPKLLLQLDDWVPTIMHSLGIDTHSSHLRGKLCKQCFE